MQRMISKVLLLAIAVSMGIFLSGDARSAGSTDKTVHLIAGKADTIQLSGPIADVLVANPAVADVGTLRADRLYMVGRTVGDTNVLAYDDAGNQLANITVHVRVDDRNLQDTLKEFFPDENITAKTVKTNVVLTGIVSTPSISSQVRDLASRFMVGNGQTLVDLMKVKGEQQVMLKVKIIEAKRSVLRDLGVETDLQYKNDVGLSIGDLGRINVSPFGIGTMVQGGKLGALMIRLRALEQEGMVNVLAEPNLTAISGETAGFLAGGEFPVPTSQDNGSGGTSVAFTFKPFGVALNFTPTVLSKDRIALHMSTEVSEKDPAGGTTIVDLVTIPGITSRKAETTVEVGSGSTLTIAGIIKADTLHNLTGLPGVENLPIIGNLFKSKSFQRNESELLIMVTPYLVKSYSDAEAVAETDIPVPEPYRSEEDPVEPLKVHERTGSLSSPSSEDVIKTENDVEMAMAMDEEPEVVETPLSRRFVDNLRKAHGNRVASKVGVGGHFGYIVE